jgi:hypothetical protein
MARKMTRQITIHGKLYCLDAGPDRVAPDCTRVTIRDVKGVLVADHTISGSLKYSIDRVVAETTAKLQPAT